MAQSLRLFFHICAVLFGRRLSMAILAASFTFFSFPQSAKGQIVTFQWEDLPELPQPRGGHFAGVHNGALIVLGGTYFPPPLFEGGEKRWLSDIQVLTSTSGGWTGAGGIEAPLAYGAAVSTPDGVICLGGSDGSEHRASVFRLKWTGNTVQTAYFHDLPLPCAMMAAALLEKRLYVAGGVESPSSPVALNTFWSLDLSLPDPTWEELEPIPGPGRILAAGCAQDGAFYLFSGAEIVVDASGAPRRRYLKDAYRRRPGGGWERIADLPRPSVAAPVLPVGQSHLLLFAGDDGSSFGRIPELGENHPGFSKEILAYHTITDTWSRSGDMPIGLATTQALDWNGDLVIPGGEDRPGHRSGRVLTAELSHARKSFTGADYAALILYLSGLVLIGAYFARRERTTDDFFLAGRRIPWWAAGLSIFGTQLSAITYLAYPAKAYATDWVYFLVNVTIVMVAPFVVYFYLPFYRRLHITTAYQYLEMRFGLGARLFGSLSHVLFQLGRMGIVLYLPALALSAATGFDIFVCILLMGFLSTVYTFLGGIEAVIWTDVAQVIVLVGGAVLSLCIIVGQFDDGWVGLFQEANRAGKFHTFNWTWDYTTTAVWVVIVGQFFANAVPYTSDQTVIQRYLTTSTEAKARQAIWTNAAMTIPATLLFLTVGTALYLFYKSHPDQIDPTLQTDAIFPLFIIQQLPSGLAGLVVAGIFAASMSSLDSSLNSVSTVIVTDFYRRFSGGVTEASALRLARAMTVLFGVLGTSIAVAMAVFDIQSLLDLYVRLLGFVGGSMAGLFALGMFTRRARSAPALAAAIGAVGLTFFVQQSTPVHFFLYGTVGSLSCFGIGYVLSLMVGGFQRPEDEALRGLTFYSLPSEERD